MEDIDMVNAMPTLVSQAFQHLAIPTLTESAKNRPWFIKDFQEKTGLGAEYCKLIVCSVMNGAKGFGIKPSVWEEMQADEEARTVLVTNKIDSPKKLNGLLRRLPWLMLLRTEREVIYGEIKHHSAMGLAKFWGPAM